MLKAWVLAADLSLADTAQSKTDIAFVGDRFSLKATFDGLWQYEAGEEVGAWITIQRKDEESASGRPRIQIFRITGRRFPDDSEALSNEWAAGADWFVATMRCSEVYGWGNDVKRSMPGAKHRKLDLFGKH